MIRNYLLIDFDERVINLANKEFAISKNYQLITFQPKTELELIAEILPIREQQPDLIIADEVTAAILKPYLSIPIIELHPTVRDLVLLINEAKSIIPKRPLNIVFEGGEQAYPNLMIIAELLQVNIRILTIKSHADIPDLLSQVIDQEFDIVIGSQPLCRYADMISFPAIALFASKEALTEAFNSAIKLSALLEEQKKDNDDLHMMFQCAINGIIQIDSNGLITRLNSAAENIILNSQLEYHQKHLATLIPQITENILKQVLQSGQSLYALPLQLHGDHYLANFIPLTVVDANRSGAILTLSATSITAKLKPSKLPVTHNFSSLVCCSEHIKQVVRQLHIFSLAQVPILILGEDSTEKEILAECTHSEGTYSQRPFLRIDCRCYTDEQQRELLVDAITYTETSDDYGTIFINHAHYLSEQNQQLLYRYLSALQCHEPYSKKVYQLERQLIFACDGKQKLSTPLSYLLANFTVSLKSLRYRPEDIITYAESMIMRYSKKYLREHLLSESAKNKLKKYTWYGNLHQLDGFCERLVLLSTRKIISAEFVHEEFERVFDWENLSTQQIDTFEQKETEEGILIRELLMKYQGNRQETADAMGVSRSTLWRKMKQYEINMF